MSLREQLHAYIAHLEQRLRWSALLRGGQSSQEASAPGRPTDSATPRKTPQTLWWYVMLLVLASAVAESVLASRYLGTQREDS